MAFIKRDLENKICAIYEKNTVEGLEEVETTNLELVEFLNRCAFDQESHFLKSDLDLIRVLEDMIHILMEKKLISLSKQVANKSDKIIFLFIVIGFYKKLNPLYVTPP